MYESGLRTKTQLNPYFVRIFLFLNLNIALPYYKRVYEAMSQRYNLYRRTSGIYVVRISVPNVFVDTQDSVRFTLQQALMTFMKQSRSPHSCWRSGIRPYKSMNNWIIEL